MPTADLTGQRFGMLTVVSKSGVDKYGISQWQCLCDCGGSSIASISNLRNGNTTSCGCYGRRRKSEANRTHGGSGTRLHRIWKAMKVRCYDQNFQFYRHYGGRGITICDEWRNNFEAFRDWALANGYEDALTIDRIDNDKGYSPDNCRWVTMVEQNQNKRAENGQKIKEE